MHKSFSNQSNIQVMVTMPAISQHLHLHEQVGTLGVWTVSSAICIPMFCLLIWKKKGLEMKCSWTFMFVVPIFGEWTEERGWAISNQLAILKSQGSPNTCYFIKGNFYSISLDYNWQNTPQEATLYENEKHANVNPCQSLIVGGSFLPSYSECSLA